MTDQQPTELLRQKIELYRSLEALDEDDDAVDPGRAASQAAWNKASAPEPPRSSAKEARTLARSVSDSRINSRAHSLSGTANIAPPSSTDPQNAVLNRSAAFLPGLRKTVSDTTTKNTTPISMKATGKRKRDVVVAKSGLQRIFDNLHFFFFPNNAVRPDRRMRIEKATEHGATWVKTWSDSVTHVILDASIEYSTLMRFLGLESLPNNVVTVRDNWPAECISYRALLDPVQRGFVVTGAQQPSKVTDAPSFESHTSLQAEAASKSRMKKRAKTPPRAPATIEPETVTLPHPAGLAEPGPSVSTLEVAPLETNEELDKAIERARLLRHVSLEEEDDHNRLDSFEGQDPADSGDEQVKGRTRRKSKFQNAQDKFQCMQKHTGDGSNSPNLPTIRILEQMADYYGQIGDEWRIRAYRKAVATLRNHPTKVQTREQALALPNVGGRLATKIEEIASTNRLQRLESARAEPGDQVLQTFMQIYGAGIVQASRWVDQGYKTLDELLQRADLTDNQRIGIERFADFNARIPRDEVEHHGIVVREALRKIDTGFEVIVGGSYRRGSKDSGDIDLIITRPDTNADHLRNVVLGQLVPQLSTSGFLVASLAITSRDDGSKWHGASCLPGSRTWRRLDLLLVPSEELGAALIYFTGNDIFNRSLRLLASTKGMRLNQRGLYEGVLRGPGRVKLTEGTLVEGRDERRIFEILGVPWRPPEHRIC